jgi:hypothetical protein
VPSPLFSQAPDSLASMFNIGQRSAVEAAFKLAGYQGDLEVAPIADETERAFLVDAEVYGKLSLDPPPKYLSVVSA